MIVQKMKAKQESKESQAHMYYSILAASNNMRLTQREIQLLSFMAVNGNIINGKKTEFCKRFKTTSPTVNNVVYNLKKTGLLVKKDNQVQINPAIALDFDKNIKLEIALILNDE